MAQVLCWHSSTASNLRRSCPATLHAAVHVREVLQILFLPCRAALEGLQAQLTALKQGAKTQAGTAPVLVQRCSVPATMIDRCFDPASLGQNRASPSARCRLHPV